MGAPSDDNPGRKKENHIVYSMGEPLGDDVLGRVTVGELRLHAPHFGAESTQRDGRPAQLENVGSVLHVVDGHDVTPGQCQAEVQRLRLGPGLGGRDHHHAKVVGRAGGAQRVESFLVVPLHEDEHLEPVGRVVELGEVADHFVMTAASRYAGIMIVYEGSSESGTISASSSVTISSASTFDDRVK